MATLRRELGKWDLTALGVNQVIGGAVFAVPATLALSLGHWSWMAVGVVGLLAMAVALNFAEAGSRFDGTGGPYLYTRAAFGRFISFEVGWMVWVVRVTSWSSVVNVLVSALGYYVPEVTTGLLRATLISGVVLVIMALNIRGIKQSSMVVNGLTIGKLTPLIVFILLGLPHVTMGALRPDIPLTWDAVAGTALILIFAFGGYEVIPVPAGEARDPQKAVPFAMIMTIVIVATVMTLAQVVAIATLPGLGASKTPLVDASALFIGAGGAALMTLGTVVSVAGNNVGAALSGSRSLFALSEQGDVPAVFGHVHRRFQTPDVAIVTTCLCTLVLALTGGFAELAAISAIARLIVYGGTCASVLAMRRKSAAPFTIPFGPAIPVIALLVCGVILASATWEQLYKSAGALAIGAILYLLGRKARA